MNVLSGREKHWRHFPALHRLFKDGSFPGDLYHHEGLRSPYTTRIDDLHDVATIAAIVGNGAELIRIAAERAADEEPGEWAARIKGLLRELDDLESFLRSFSEDFLGNLRGDLRQQQVTFRQAYGQARQEEGRRRITADGDAS